MKGEKVAELRYSVALDNHEPTRLEHYDVMELWRREDGSEVVRVPAASSIFKDAEKALYLLDDGSSVVPYYVAGWNPSNDLGTIFLHPMPTNPDGKRRDDRDEVIDHSNWRLGPRRAYHLKIKRV